MNEQLVRSLLDESTLLALAPLLALTAGVVLLLLADILPRMSGARPFVVLASIATAYAFEMRILRGGTIELFDGTFYSGPTTAAFGILFLASTLIAWAVSHNYYREEKSFLGEHDILMLCAAAGMMLMAGAQDLLVFFVGLELLSIPLYTLAGFRRARSQSVEAGIKYFVLGAFATATLLYGTALLYTATGTVSLTALRTVGVDSPIAIAGVALIAASLFFKASVFPFHLWVPDVYQGSPTPITAFMATGTKAAAFAFLLNATFLLPSSATPIVVAIAILTMAAGNLGALVQTDVKRLLAYSGVAHAGTLLLAIAGSLAGDPQNGGATQAVLFYMAAYVFTAGGAFGLVAWLESETDEPVTIDSLKGLARRRPAVAAALALFMLSLGGIPATGGFLGKYLVFAVAVRAHLIVAAVIGVTLSVVALAYYLRVVVAMYMQPEVGTQARTVESRLPVAVAAGVCALMVVLLGVLPGWFLTQLGS